MTHCLSILNSEDFYHFLTDFLFLIVLLFDSQYYCMSSGLMESTDIMRVAASPFITLCQTEDVKADGVAVSTPPSITKSPKKKKKKKRAKSGYTGTPQKLNMVHQVEFREEGYTNLHSQYDYCTGINIHSSFLTKQALLNQECCKLSFTAKLGQD